MNCPNCGTPTQPGQKFCASCGAALTSPSPLPAPQPHITASPTQAAYYQSPSTPAGARISHAPRSAAAKRSGTGPLLVALGSLALLGLLLVLGLLAWLRAANTSTPIVVDSSQVLGRAQAALDDIQSVKYEAEAGFFGIDTSGSSVTSTRALTVSIEGDIALPDKYTLVSPVPQLGNYIVIGDTTWHRRNAGSTWDRQDTSAMSLGLINPLNFLKLLQYHKPGTAVHIGSEERGETTLHRIRFAVDIERMALEIGDPATRSILATSRVDVDAWIDDKTHYMHRMTVSVESDDGTGIILRTDFSDYNVPVDITPPE